jgi:hypothetical protein
METKQIHIFEAAGLGIAPFTVHSVSYEKWDSCQFCGTAIREHCYIKDSNGKIFYVVNECVYKTGDAGLVNETKLKVNKLRTERRHEKEDEKIALAQEILSSNERVKETLKNSAHTYSWENTRGKSLLDYVEGIFQGRYSSRTAKLAGAKVVLNALENPLSEIDFANLVAERTVFIA